MTRRSRTLIARVVVLAALLLAVASCGYRLSGANTFLPESIHVIAVLPFENRTNRPEIEQRVTEDVARELSTRGKYEVITAQRNADATLVGIVTSYRSVPVAFTAAGRATRMESVITIQATLRQTSDDEILWSQSGLIFKQQYDVPESGLFVDEESAALTLLAQGVAGVLVTSILEGF